MERLNPAKVDSQMTKYTISVVLFALIGTGLCGLVASQAKATVCNTSCYTIMNQQYCNTTCF